MTWLRWLVIVAAVLESGFMVVDGTHALTTGDYFTPRSGPYAGQLGPWASVVSRAGVQPRSTAMKVTFVVLGAAWLAVVLAFARGASWSWFAMLAFALGTLWYFPVGTILSVVQLAALWVLRSNAA